MIQMVTMVISQDCPVYIPDEARRECHPWPNATQQSCEDRGCVFCPSESLDPIYPWCFYNDKVCPSTVPEAERVSCQPEAGTRDECLTQGCLWCETQTEGIPWCFADPASSLGGAVCPVDIPETERINCHPDAGQNEAECLKRGCYWCNTTQNERAPFCFMPKQAGYRMQGSPVETPEGWRITLDRVDSPSLYGQDVRQVTVDVELHTQDRLRVKFYDSSNPRFEVPLPIIAPGPKPTVTDYDITFENDPVFSFKVTRVNTGVIIFDSSIGGLQFADQFIQLSTRLDSPNVYGFGEHEHATLQHDMDWVTWAMWARDQWVTDSNLYGVQPFYMNIEQSSNAHGVLFLNANAQEVTLLPAPALTYRTTGGVLDMYIFMGPTPEQVVQQFTPAVGYPLMPPYWALGFQLCRFGYSNLDELKAAVDRMRQYDIPHDIQYGDIDYMDGRKDFTIDEVNFAGLEEYVDDIKTEGTRFVILLDPAIYSAAAPGEYLPLDRGTELDVWIKDPSGQGPAQGEVWPGPTYFPDYFKPATEQWWTTECVEFRQRLKYDGLWIDMNEPANFVDGSPTGCNDNRWNFPPYVPAIKDGKLWQMTTCMDTLTEGGISYNTHSLYGWSMARQTLPAVRTVFPGKRSIVFSRSTFPGAGQWGQHWLGDNYSTWTDLRASIIGMLEFNMFGIPYVGADICGFHATASEELCRRWQQLGAFYPFSRNHNGFGNPDQDPGMWPTVAADTRAALLIRYRLLPYLYTLHYRAHTTGSTVVRPLFFEFSSDSNTYGLDQQFLWGSALLISPALELGSTTVNAYFPDARWFDYYSGSEEPSRGSFVDLDTPLGDINLHVRGGFIIPVQQPANSTMWSRSNPMGLIIGLDDNGSASGGLFWDDGESLDTHLSGLYFEVTYTVSDNTLTNTVITDGYPDMSSLMLDDVEILGAPDNLGSVLINGAEHSDWTQDPTSLKLTISTAGLQMNSLFTVSWS